jgi:hypothetical protein
MNMSNDRVLNRVNARELTIEETADVAAGTLTSYKTATGGHADVLTVED